MKIVIIGAGVNGLVAANYLARAGHEVTVIERKDHPGGACCFATVVHEGEVYTYPQGASVLGMMEDFIFEETGLKDRVTIHRPSHPEIVYTPEYAGPGLVYEDPKQCAAVAAEQWGEHGDVEGFLSDLDTVTAFLRQGYRDAIVPDLQRAEQALGKEMVARWITGSARNLLDHYLTSNPFKFFYGISVYESGPVSFDAPYSAFTIPLMASGSIFDGEWGYVKGGIWQIPMELDAINAELGVTRVFNASVTRFSTDGMTVEYEHDGRKEKILADHVIFATDPLTAAEIAGEAELKKKILAEKLLGTSGKLVMFFRNPVRWKDDTHLPEFQAAFRHIIPVKDLDESEAASNMVAEGKADFTPGYFEVYCEGAGNRDMGGKRNYDLVSVFFKNVGFGKEGKDMPEVREKVAEYILEKIENREDLVHTILETPKDISELFFFPQGNIDAIELAEGQTFFQRTFSADPEGNFYQFGSDPRISYCAAGAYPCGSVAGTPGYMCAQQLMKNARERSVEKELKNFDGSFIK